MNKDPQIIITGLALLALSSANVAAAPASATATNFEGCHALLNMGLYNVTQSDSAKSAEYQAMASFCAYDYSSSSISSSQAASIEASYGLFSGGGGYSGNRQEVITKQSQVCTLGFNSSKYWEKASAYSKTVYQGSLDAWNRCQELANKGMEFDVQPSSTMQGVNVAITAPSGYQAIFYGVTQHGQGRSTCKIMANGKITPISLTKPFTFDAASKVTVDCNRIMKKNGNDLSADAQDMIFVTSAKNLVVPLAAIGSFSRVTADQLRSETKATADQLRSETKATADQLTDSINEGNAAISKRLEGITLKIVRELPLYDMAAPGEERNCLGDGVVYGFRNAENNIQALDMWRCAFFSIQVPPK